MKKIFVIVMLVIVNGFCLLDQIQAYDTNRICLNRRSLTYRFSKAKPHKNILLKKEQEQWTNFIKAKPEGHENKIFDRTLEVFFNSPSKEPRRAVNFGSGSGREDLTLLKQGWEVLSIDVSAYSGELISLKSKEYKGKSHFFHGRFIDAKLEGKYDLIMSFYSLPFEDKANLVKLMGNIAQHLHKRGILLVNFYGYEHDFVKQHNIAYGISQAELFALLSFNGFKILSFENQIYPKKNRSTDKVVNWEVLEVLAMKN